MLDTEILEFDTDHWTRRQGLAIGSETFSAGHVPAEKDEDENLVGAGSLGRGKPTYRFFDTLEYRVGNPDRELS